MMDQAIAESGSHKAPLGLAMNMYKQLQRDGFTQGSQTQAQAIELIADKLKVNTQKPELGGSHG
jgi:Rod binding domain-containing protein